MYNMLYQYGASARRICRLCCINLVVILYLSCKLRIIELFAIHCTRYISCVMQLFPIIRTMILLWQVQPQGPSSIELPLCGKRATIMAFE